LSNEITVRTSEFEQAQREAKAISSSELVPKAFQNNIPNTLIAMEMAQRTSFGVMTIMQNIHVIHGRPGFSSQFLIACVNHSRRFSPMRFNMTGEKGTDGRTCVAYATDLETGEIVEGPEVSIGMAKADGWWSRKDSKWPRMPDLMLHYRAGTFFARLYAPEILMGMRTTDEIHDIAASDSRAQVSVDSATSALAAATPETDPETGQVIPDHVGKEESSQ